MMTYGVPQGFTLGPFLLVIIRYKGNIREIATAYLKTTNFINMGGLIAESDLF